MATDTQSLPSVPLVEYLFKSYERFLRSLETDGGRTLLLLILVIAGYGTGALGLPGGEDVGAASLIVLILRLSRSANSKGVVSLLLSIFKKGAG